MRLVPTRSLESGQQLARPILSDKGQILIQKNVTLTDKMIERLLQLDVSLVYINDELSEGITIESPIPEALKTESIQTVKSLFLDYKSQGHQQKSYLFQHANSKLTPLVDEIINQIQHTDYLLSMVSDIFISDDFLFEHSINVTIYAVALANELNLSNREIRQLGIGAMLHDIGKIFIPEEIIKKPGRLSEEEFSIIKSHTELGFDFLRQVKDLPLLIAHCAYQHHERLDGTGYPRGIKEDSIHTFGKILAIADVFDAVTSHRVYRSAMLPEEGLEILYSGSGTLFDKEMVRVFRDNIAIYPNGMTIQLSDQRTAIVVMQNKYLNNRPIVRIIKENNEQVTPYEIDLSQCLDVTVIGHELNYK